MLMIDFVVVVMATLVVVACQILSSSHALCRQHSVFFFFGVFVHLHSYPCATARGG
jgi:hypothetical protein